MHRLIKQNTIWILGAPNVGKKTVFCLLQEKHNKYASNITRKDDIWNVVLSPSSIPNWDVAVVPGFTVPHDEREHVGSEVLSTIAHDSTYEHKIVIVTDSTCADSNDLSNLLHFARQSQPIGLILNKNENADVWGWNSKADECTTLPYHKEGFNEVVLLRGKLKELCERLHSSKDAKRDVETKHIQRQNLQEWAKLAGVLACVPFVLLLILHR